MRISLPPPVLHALQRLEQAGHAAYVVGGCVRSVVLGLVPHEYDLTTAATPEQVTSLFSDMRVIPTGIQHGTVTVLMQGMPLEITTFRSDGTYSDARHPDQVRFSTNVLEDLARRDFTCNAMAYSPTRGLVDPYDGRQACADKMLIAVGNPKERFREDALRILRGLRFAATLGFHIHPDTHRGMLAVKQNIQLLSRERVAAECNKLLLAAHPENTLRAYPELIRHALPILGEFMQDEQGTGGKWQQALSVLALTPEDLALRWAALMHPAGPIAAQQALRDLRQPNGLIQQVHALLTDLRQPVSQAALPRWLARLGLQLTEKLLWLQQAAAQSDLKPEALQAPPLLAHARHLWDTHPCLSLRQLPVNGQDLLHMGYAPGPALGQALEWLFQQVLDGTAPADRAHLLTLARQRLQGKEQQ